MSPEAKAAANQHVGGQYQRAPSWMSDEKSIILKKPSSQISWASLILRNSVFLLSYAARLRKVI
jgi:hypothetical protein